MTATEQVDVVVLGLGVGGEQVAGKLAEGGAGRPLRDLETPSK